MKVNVLRGENQIGGNIIEISTEKTKILLDVGLELDDEKNIQKPEIKGLFDFKGYDGVFISHYHGDHFGLAYDIHKDIPIYMGEQAYKIIKASDEYKGKNTVFPTGFLKNSETIIIKDIKITPYLCDHSAFDSYMLLCEAESEKVLYTGDFRDNGRKGYDKLLSQLPKKIDTLICEGTTLSRIGYIAETESSLENKAVELFKSTNAPIFVLQSSMNIDRVVTMYRAAKRSNRVFLEELYMADITSSVGGSIPNPNFNDVYAFITTNKRYDGLKKYKNKLGKSQISKKSFVMCIRTSMLRYLKSLSKMMDFKNGILVYSFWNGYKETEEMKNFLNECEKLGLKIVSIHTSGHADMHAIEELIKCVKPNRIIPIHTENAKWFDKFIKQ